jgi:hypothetical protein
MLILGGIFKEKACNSDFRANKKGRVRSTLNLNLINLVNTDFQRG